jgi:hypothetical protein
VGDTLSARIPSLARLDMDHDMILVVFVVEVDHLHNEEYQEMIYVDV